MTEFLSRTWNERVAGVENALAVVLPALTHPAPTALVVERVAAELKLGADYHQAISSILFKIVKSIPNARHDGSTFKSFGRECRRWVWDPGAYRPGVAMTVRAQAVAGAPLTFRAVVNRFYDWAAANDMPLMFLDRYYDTFREWIAEEDSDLAADMLS